MSQETIETKLKEVGRVSDVREEREESIDKGSETDETRPRKRKLLKGTRDSIYDSLSLRNREEETPRRKPVGDRANGQAETRRSEADPDTEKPEWMKDSDYLDFSKRVDATVGPPARKQIKRNRRTVADQMRAAEEMRRMREERDNRMIQNNLQQYHANGNIRNDDIVRSHYNARTHISRGVNRNKSPIIKLRKFNNIIKYMLINKFVKAGDKVLDLGCGKGGDLHKWHKSKVSQYVGIDISNESVLELIRRFQTMRSASFESVFATGDAFNTPVTELLSQFPQVEFPMDMVTMQFVMHYAFSSESSIRNLLKNISQSLKVGGTFIGTIPSSDVIAEKIKQLPPGEKKFGNSIYSVTFDEPPPLDGEFENILGNMYRYYLEDAVDDVPEFVVPFEAFRALAEEYDLSLVYKKKFSELFTEEIPSWVYKLDRGMLEGIRRDDGSYGILGDEFEASDFYLAFAFERVGFQ